MQRACLKRNMRSRHTDSKIWARAVVTAEEPLQGSVVGKSWIDWPASARDCPQHRGTISVGGKTRGMQRCLSIMGETGLKSSLGGCSESWMTTKRALVMHFRFLFMPKRVDVSGCESHKTVMTAVAEGPDMKG